MRLHLVRAAVAALLLLASPAAFAGQLRVDVMFPNFTPSTGTINAGDHVVWVWNSSHTVTSGTRPVMSGLFDTGFVGGSARFSWKSAVNGTVPYYCAPHSGMNASVTVVSSGAPVSDFRLTEVDFGAAGDLDFIEITNLGQATGNLGQYRVSVTAGGSFVLPLVDVLVAPGARVVLRLNQSGANSQTELFFAGVTLGRQGSVGLYVPNTLNTSLADASMMIDFVQWGAGAQANETTAATAGFWAGGAFAPAVADGHSIEYCGSDPSQRGAAFWQGSPSPTPGGSNCVTATFKTTWGRLKTLYR